MKLCTYDVYQSMTRFLARDQPLVFVDVGANEGLAASRMLAEFPRACVHAFEPAPDTFRLLQRNTARERRVRIYPQACGSSVGSVPFHIANNTRCSSVLRPSELGKRFYGNAYLTRQTVDVPILTLDSWAKQHAIDRVDVLKIDAQGYDLEVLRGATALLAAGVKAINCGCRFAPVYEGCSTFSKVDQFLGDHGYVLHQLYDLDDCGSEEQVASADGLWLHAEVLGLLRSRVESLTALSPFGRIRDALTRAARDGARCAALYGAGMHTRDIADRLARLPLPVVAILDDNPAMHGTALAGIEVIAPAAAQARGVDVVVLSSDAREPELWRNSARLRAQGIRVLPLYDPHLADDVADLARAAHASVPAPVLA